MSREHGILFSAPMVRAILDGSKTQTRRALRLPTGSEGLNLTLREVCEYPADQGGGLRAIFDTNEEPFSVRCPYGRVGDRLWVRETWAPHPDEDGAVYRATDPGWDDNGTGLKWRPSIHMPRWASRITLEIAAVRVQRLHDISEADIRAEGVTPEAVKELCGLPDEIHPEVLSPIDQWRWGWEGINRVGSWDANPWLWCLSFRRVQP